MPIFQEKDSLHGIRISDTERQSMLYPISSFLPNLHRILIPIYDLQKKAKKFKWTEEAEKAFNEIKKLLINPPVLKAPTPDGLFQLKSDT